MPPRQEQTPPPMDPDDVVAASEVKEAYTNVQMDEVKPKTSPPPAPPPAEPATLFQLPEQKKRLPFNSAQIKPKFRRRYHW